MAYRLSAGLAVTLFLSAAPMTAAQDVTIEALGAPTAFDAGALTSQDVSLPSSLWTGTSAARAAILINSAPTQSDDPVVRAMVRAALLSGGVPPEGNRDAFETARLGAVMGLGDKQALTTFLVRNPALGQTPAARVNLALGSGDSGAACGVADEITEGRAKPEWARLRAMCHLLRDELPAAELTRDLLQSSGYQDPSYFALLSIMAGNRQAVPAPSASDDNLIRFMRVEASGQVNKSVAMDPAAKGAERLKAVWANLSALSQDELSAIMSDIAYDETNIEASSSFDLATAAGNMSPQGTAQLYQLAKSGNPKALSELAKRSDGNTAQLMAAFTDDILSMPTELQAEADLKLFANAAVTRRDVTALQGLYNAAQSRPNARARLALAADAIGNGYSGGPVGKDIDSRLQGSEALGRAKRDASLALALGSNLSDAARDALTAKTFSDGRTVAGGDRVLIWSAANNGSLAELLLMCAGAANGEKLDTDSLAFLVATLQSAGLTEFAGQLAARDFLDGL